MDVLVEAEVGLVGLVDDEDVPDRPAVSNPGCTSRKRALYFCRSQL
jgi:hypothetical protein